MTNLEKVKSMPAIADKISHIAQWESAKNGVELQLVLQKNKDFTSADVAMLRDTFNTKNVSYRTNESGSSIWIKL